MIVIRQLRPFVRRSVTGAVVLALLALAVAMTGPAHALAPTPVFAPYLNYNVGKAQAVAVGDFTGDGRNDVVISTEDSQSAGTPNHVWLLAQGPDGWLNRVDVMETEMSGAPELGLAAGDLDGDGLTDAVVANGNALDLFLQRAGGLDDGRPIPLAGVQQVEAADVDGDGRVDLVANGTGGVVLLRALGAGAFAPPVILSASQHAEVQVGDVTGDSRPDVVTCDRFAIQVLAQLPGGGFASPAARAGDVGCESLALADVNGDGRTDVSFVGGGNFPSSRLDVFPQQRDGSLAGKPTTYMTRDIPGAVKAGDMNADGRTDLVVLHESWLSVGVHAQGPDHTLDPERGNRIPYANSGSPKALAIGDVNGDRRPDILIADDQHGLVVLWGQVARPSTTTTTSRLATTVPTNPAGTPPPLFSSAQTYDVGATGESAATGDFNGDGRTDVAMSTLHRGDPDTSYKLYIFYQGASGSLERAVSFDTEVAAGTGDIAVLAAGDLDGDGRTDLVLRTREGLNLFMQRDGTFADRVFREFPYANRVDIADLDGDGKGDLVMTGAGITVHRSLGAGTFAPPVTVTSDHRSELAIGDVTGDGRLDLVTLDAGASRSVVVHRQLAGGGWAAGVGTFAGGAPQTLTIGDFNGDGRLDVAAAHNLGGSISTEHIQILTQGPDGTLAAAADIRSSEVGPLRAGDVDGDGRTDLVVIHGGSVGVLLQQQDGQLAPERSHRLPGATRYDSTGAVLADFTGDRRLDVAVANYSHGLDVVRNVTSGVAQPATPAGTYHPLPPKRVLDTRSGLGGPAARLGPGGTISLQVTGAGGVPASGVSAVVLNVTVTEPTAVSFLTASPAGEPRPVASNLNYVPGQTVPNLVVVKIGQDGKIDLFNSAGTTHVLADVAGWYGTDGNAAVGRYNPVNPARVLDTRSGVGAPAEKLGPGGALGLQVTGRGSVPATGVSAVVLNVTATDPTAVSFLTAWPSGEARPVASNLNYVPGQTVANLVMVKVGLGGRIDLFNNLGTTNVVADVAGWYGDGAQLAGGAFTPLAPARVLDTRSAVGAPTAKLGADGTLGLQVTGRGGVPAAGVSAVVLNVTVTEPTATSFLTAWPNGEARPLASNLNYGPGQTVPNLVVVKVGAGGKVDLFNNAGATHVVADVAGWYGPG